MFAASFFLVSRYEEYLTFQKDEHGRFPANASIAGKYGFLDQPVVNLWSQFLQQLLKDKFPSLTFHKKPFKFKPSYDIDHAWAFKHKGFFRTTTNLFKALITFDRAAFAFRLNVLRGKLPDPYHTFDHIETIAQRYNCAPIFFFLFGRYGIYDKNVSIKSKFFQSFIKKIATKYETGIHPSYQSNINNKIVSSEINNLYSVTGKSIENSRQHYLILRFPHTYQIINELGVKHDYTMGYASQPGFRAGIAHSFLWYDLTKETTTSLTIHPFQVMDVTLKHYLKLDVPKAKERILHVLKATKEVDGEFIPLWHNNSLSEIDGWEGWRAVHDFIFEAVAATEKKQ